MIPLGGWTDKRGWDWKRATGPRAEPGWLFCDKVYGTVCFERGRWVCYRLPSQTTPCARFDTLHDAADFMAENPA